MIPDTLPASRVIKLEVHLVLPVAATRDQVDEWVGYEILQDGSISNDNPLLSCAPQAFGEHLLTDTGKHCHVEVKREPLVSTETIPTILAGNAVRVTRREWLSDEPFAEE